MLYSIEFSYKKTPVKVREKLSFSYDELPTAYENLLTKRIWTEVNGPKAVCTDRCSLDVVQFGVLCPKTILLEAFILSTCNRTTIIGLGGCPEPLVRFLMAYKSLSYEEAKQYVELRKGIEVVKHIFSIAAGLESQAIGEHEIMGQIKKSFEIASRVSATGAILNRLISHALSVGKKVRNETSIGKEALSLAGIATAQIKKHFNSLSDKVVTLVGTGQIARSVLKNLEKTGVKKIYVISREYQRAQNVIDSLNNPSNAEALDISQLSAAISSSDIVIAGSDARNGYIISAQNLHLTKDRHGPLIIIDLGIPRNVDPQISNVFPFTILYNMDSLKEKSEDAKHKRIHAIPEAQEIINRESLEFWKWFKMQKARPIIKALHERVDRIRHEQIKQFIGSDDNVVRGTIEDVTHRLVKKFLHTVTEGLRSYAQTSDEHELIAIASKLFKLELDTRETITRIMKQQFSINTNKPKTIIVGTRGSKLALAQTKMVIAKLKQVFPNIRFVEKIITTQGDKGIYEGDGVFTKAIQRSLLDKEIDIAVHSAKDIPTTNGEGLKIAAIPVRESPYDALISVKYDDIEQLPIGARVGTSSIRRATMLKRFRKDLQIVPLRGNIDTRIRKLEEGLYDAIIVSEVGPRRLGMDSLIKQVLPEDIILPAPAQGAIALEVRADDEDTMSIVTHINDPLTFACVLAERTFMKLIGGFCNVPLGALATIKNSKLVLRGAIIDPLSLKKVEAEVKGSPLDAEILGEQLAYEVLDSGGEKIVKAFQDVH